MGMRIPGMATTLAVSVTGAVVLASAAGAYLYSTRHYDTLLRTARENALAQGELIHAALEHQMIENDRSLIERMIRTFGKERGVKNVMLLDREGRLRYSSAETDPETVLSIDSPTCQACHRLPPAERASSRVIDTSGGKLLRSVIPVRNREACFGCHPASNRINGILIVDVDTSGIRATVDRDLRVMAMGSGAIALLLVAVIAVVVRLVVMRRLQRFEATARLIAAGHLDRRVPVHGSDTLAWLGQELNTMADSMTGLLRDARTQSEQLEIVINGIGDGIVVLDVDRKVVAANDAFLRRSGRSRAEVLGTSCRDAATGTCGAGDCPTQACLHSGEGQVRICERRGPGGETVWEEVHASPIRMSSGNIVQVVEVWRDITDRRAAEARLAESHRLASLGMLASGFSHELNTPLATALTCVEAIQRTLHGTPAPLPSDRVRIDESATIAREQLLRCRGVTQHFLRLSRGSASADCLVELGPAFEAVLRLLEPTARAHGVSVELRPMPPGLHVRVNEAELQHVLLNLLLNAVQACEHGGTTQITVVTGDPIRVRITDNGCGIAPENLKRIFDPFFSARRGGTGLGLFLSIDFVRHWGGDIRVESAPAAGSTFEVVLPAAGSAGSPRPVA
jgi:PAS domain S-box-containing protein